MTTVEDLLREARAGLRRVTAVEAHEEVRSGALLLDIRGDYQRECDGTIPGARFVPRNVFEWRCDPSSRWCEPAIVHNIDRRIIVICDEGYQSSLVAATLIQFGFTDVGDVIDGFQAWRAAGLPVQPVPTANLDRYSAASARASIEPASSPRWNVATPDEIPIERQAGSSDIAAQTRSSAAVAP